VKSVKIRLLAVLVGVLMVAGCANIPSESLPVVISGDKQSQGAVDVPEPAKGLDPLTVVRDFVRASALPAASYAAAAVYLTDDARTKWKPANGLTIIDDTFGTVNGVDELNPSDPADRSEQTVIVRGFTVGNLGTDSAFIPANTDYRLPVHVRLQPDGQWRITNPPPNLVITETDFTTNYVRVSVNFYAQDSGSFVPDLRYIVAKPQSGLPSRVMDLLLRGPSNGLNGAVVELIPDQATTESNVLSTDDGSLLVPLTGVSELPIETKRLIAAQIVLSLQTVTSNRIKILSDGTSLVPGHDTWRGSDLPQYNLSTSPSSDLAGMMVVDGRVKSLADGQPILGPAGNGAYKVVSAAQSIDGKRLALVEQVDGRLRLRAGDIGRDEQIVDLGGDVLTRPTWRPTQAGGGVSGEVWTVVDGHTVARVVQSPEGKWGSQGVNSTELTQLGQITALRLSRDGARVAAVIGGHLVIASVVRTPEGVTLRAPRSLRSRELTDVVDVDWLGQETLVAVTSSASLPVVKVPIDGLRIDAFNSSNLTLPLHAVTAALNRPIIVADGGGLWIANELGEVWRPHAPSAVGAFPFYPG
jgi:outer membrane murein-binding lipoprotein Lpp